jgi:hypothetical protein
MKNAIFILWFVLSVFTLHAECNWFVKHTPSLGNEVSIKMLADAQNNLIVVGHFNNTLQLENKTLLSTGGGDIFIYKTDTLGNIFWLKKIGGILDDIVTDAGVDKNGNIYVLGTFSNTAQFDTITINSFGSNDVFLAKYNNDGNIVWVKQMGSTLNDISYNLVVTDTALVFSSSFSGEHGFYLNDTIARYKNNAYFTNNVLAFLNYDGVLLNYKTFNMPIQYFEFDSSNNLYIASEYAQYSVFTTDTFKLDTFSVSGSNKIYIVKFNAAFEYQWGENAEGSSYYYFSGMKLINDKIVIYGKFNGSFIYKNQMKNSIGNNDIYIVSLKLDGNIEWFNTIASNNINNIYSLNILSDKFIVSGKGNNGSTYFNQTIFNIKEYFIAEYDFWGNITNVNTGFGQIFRSIIPINQSLYFSGRVFSNSVFGPKKINNNLNDDIVFAKVTDFNVLKVNNPEICVVSAENGKNKIVVNPVDNISKYIFYKNSVTGSYDSIGFVNQNSSVSFIDNESVPAKQSYQYKVKGMDVCGNSTVISDSHQSIHLMVYAGVNQVWNLNWSAYYAADYFRLYRGANVANLILFDSVNSSTLAYTDLLPPAGTLYYKIEPVLSISCSPTTKAFSNVAMADGLSDINSLYNEQKPIIFPNPNNGQFNVNINTLNDVKITIYNSLGEVVFAEKRKLTQNNQFAIDLKSGIYLMQMHDGSSAYKDKLIIE